RVGSRLFSMVVNQANVEGDRMNAIDWARALRKALATTSLLQVSRTVRAEYVFPWALVYDIPMSGPDFRFCRITQEWDPSGTRNIAEKYNSCPFSGDGDQIENFYCPFVFWGLKHVIEQPPSLLKKRNGRRVLSEPVNMVETINNAPVSLGITRDPELDQKL